MNSKKIAFALTNYNEKPDGIAIYSENLLKAIIENIDSDVDVIITQKHSAFIKKRFNNKFNFEKINKIKFIELKYSNKLYIFLYLLFFFNSRGYKLIICPSLLPTIIFFNKSLKVIHDYTFKKYSKSLNLYQIFYRYVLHIFLFFDNYIGYISKSTLKDIEIFGFSFLKNKKKYFLPNSVNIFKSTLKASKKSKNKLNFLYVGSLNYHKGFDNCIIFLNEFINHFPNFKISINFAGKKKKQTNEILLKNKINTNIEYTIEDYVSDQRLTELYSKSDFLIFLSRNEGFGLPIFEAIHHNCIPILSNIDIFRELIQIKDYPFYNEFKSNKEISIFIQKIYDNNKFKNEILHKLKNILHVNEKNFIQSVGVLNNLITEC